MPVWLLEGLELSGHGVLWFVIVFIIAMLPSVPWNVRIVAINLEFAMVLDLIAVGGCKLLVRRARPHYAERHYKAHVVADQYSFPSGHASRSILVAGLFCVCKDFMPGFVVWLVVLWGVLTSTSRVLLGRHYLSDVMVGALLGVAVTAMVTAVRALVYFPKSLGYCSPVLLDSNTAVPTEHGQVPTEKTAKSDAVGIPYAGNVRAAALVD